MPAKRMNAAVGSTLKVIGNSKAMVSAGPSPGRTPIAVPKVVPTRHHRRFIGVSATAKPLRSCWKASMSAALHPDHPFYGALDQTRTDIDAERQGETEIGDECKSCADQGIAHDPVGSKPARDAHEQNDRSDGKPDRADQDDVEHEPGSDPEQGRSIGRDGLLLLGLPAASPSIDEQEETEHSQGNGRHHRDDGGPDFGVDRRYRDRHGLPEHDDRQHEHAGADDRFAKGWPRARSGLFWRAAGHCHASPSSLRMPSIRAVSPSRKAL